MHLFTKTAAVLVLGLCLPAGWAEAAHPFYQRLLREGSAALSRKDYSEARELLQLGTFGYLSEPQGLVVGLVELAVAEAEGGRPEDFQGTFQRILEVEDRFGAYTAVSLDPTLEARFEEIVAQRVPASTLRSSEAFRPIAHRIEVERIGALPRSERREALRALLAEDPGDEATALMSAELELQAGQGDAAAEVLEVFLRSRPEHLEARCLLGRAHSLAGRCDSALSFLESCPQAREQADLALALLSCYSETLQWRQGEAFFQGLDRGVAQDRQVARLGRRIQKEARKLPESLDTGEPQETDGDLPEVPAQEPTSSDASPTAPPPTPSAADRLSAARPTPKVESTSPPSRETLAPKPAPVSAADLAQLDEARRLLARARVVTDLEMPLDLARGVADRNPGIASAQHLVAEIAYRASRWRDAARYFRRGGDPGDERPNVLFFMAVSFYETGDLEGARAALTRCLPKLQPTPFVKEYTEKILNNQD
ncbi:MAG: hypothetical protein KDD47_24825 [Acidobacteria bacterium]|nr:hypothetical protein [Acidobacteriota bacterium]